MKYVITLFALFIGSLSLQARNADEVTPLLIGSSVPKVNVVDEKGTQHFLPALMQGKHSIVVFYRGGWCPYCSLQMQELAAAEAQFIELGYQIIGISPDTPEMISTIEKDGELPYALYSDSSFAAAEAFGIDFTRSSRKPERNRLPVSSVFIVTPDSKIAFSYVNPDYRIRIPGALLLAAAEALTK